MCKILIVEDEALPRMVLSRVLERDGHEVVCAMSASEAAQICRDFSPQVAIVDWIMHGEGTGLTVVDMLYAHCPDTRVIICSGLPAEIIVEQLGAREIACIVTKPVELAHIRALVTTYCQEAA